MLKNLDSIIKYIREDKEKGGDLYQYLRHKLKHRKRLVSGKKRSDKKPKTNSFTP
ncbi:hypothetical protein QIU19_07285 [Capnocytophaga canimorsus]|nr:hypothetical protein [Capnocytophaga canimorsus]WGU69436.1 hypothetical protein QIU19_07285 [Capnocytophaga canimorsus]